MPSAKNWLSVTQSSFSWEREALDFVRSRFPAHDPYRAWSNFEFIADDGSINEVDLLVFTPQGFFLVEIKSRPGRLFGDAGTWTWETEGRLSTVDSPLIAANLKAKKLATLLVGRNNKIEVIGHAAAKYIPPDSPWRSLDELSYQRAENVKDLLLEYGLDDRVFRLQAVGMREPVRARAVEPEDAAENRRVEVILTEILVEEVSADALFTDETAARGG